jgi:hypothetical protein
MNFNTLIKTNNWLSVKATLLALYPDQKSSITAYEEVFEKLKWMTPVEVSINIVLYQYYDDETFKPSCVDVAGINLKPSKDDINDSLAIEYSPWNQWLGMEIGELTLKEFTELEIISHCLNEMTYAGFIEEEIQADLKRIENVAEEYRSMTDEEKKMNTTTLDDLMKKFDIKDTQQE